MTEYIVRTYRPGIYPGAHIVGQERFSDAFEAGYRAHEILAPSEYACEHYGDEIAVVLYEDGIRTWWKGNICDFIPPKTFDGREEWWAPTEEERNAIFASFPTGDCSGWEEEERGPRGEFPPYINYKYLYTIMVLRGEREKPPEKKEAREMVGNTEILEKLGNRWVSSRGQVRYYVNDWKQMIGMHVEYYHTGNVKSVWLDDGTVLSNCSYNRDVRGAKVWVDEDLGVHIDYMGKEYVEGLVRAAMAERIAALEA